MRDLYSSGFVRDAKSATGRMFSLAGLDAQAFICLIFTFLPMGTNIRRAFFRTFLAAAFVLQRKFGIPSVMTITTLSASSRPSRRTCKAMVRAPAVFVVFAGNCKALIF